MSNNPFIFKYQNNSIEIPADCKRYCHLLIPGKVISGGRQLCYQRVIDNENLHLFAKWCNDNNMPSLFKAKTTLCLEDVHNHFFPPLFDDSDIEVIEIKKW